MINNQWYLRIPRAIELAEWLVELTVGPSGLWTAKLPFIGVDKAISLTVKDGNGRLWKVRSFYPNYNTQPLIENGAQQVGSATEWHALSVIRSAAAATLRLKFNNYARATASYQGRTYYDWRVFVDEPEGRLAEIQSVQYLLHPSFPDPLQIRTNPADRFALEAHGWGVFTIKITITYKNGTAEYELYNLDFSKGWPTVPAPLQRSSTQLEP
jgi:hypothetical protein